MSVNACNQAWIFAVVAVDCSETKPAFRTFVVFPIGFHASRRGYRIQHGLAVVAVCHDQIPTRFGALSIAPGGSSCD